MTTTTTCSWGSCDAEATLTLPGPRGTEHYCSDCCPERVAELTELARSGDEAAVRVALAVHLDRCGLRFECDSEYADDGRETGRWIVTCQGDEVRLSAAGALREVASWDESISADGAWGELEARALTPAEQLYGYVLCGEAELDTLRGGDVQAGTGTADGEALTAEATRVGGTVRWHRPTRRPVVAVKVAGRWLAKL